MKGRFLGQPRSVLVAATEDSWEHTIVPRLMAAGADLDRVFRIDVVTEDGVDGLLTLPSDIADLHEAVRQSDAALVLLDPLMSRLSAHLDSHKDAEVRVALEPLTAFAKRAHVAVLGIIHVNKSSSADALNMIMGSRAFGAVARAVLMAVKNPEDDTCLFGLAKNNLASKDHRRTATALSVRGSPRRMRARSGQGGSIGSARPTDRSMRSWSRWAREAWRACPQSTRPLGGSRITSTRLAARRRRRSSRVRAPSRVTTSETSSAPPPS